MNLTEKDFEFVLQREDPKKPWLKAICPKCRSPHEKYALDEYGEAKNLKCGKCQYKFCSFCGGSRHLMGKCKRAKEVQRKSSIENGIVLIPLEE